MASLSCTACYVGRFRVFVGVMEGLPCVLCVHTMIYAGIKYGTLD
jgi:hypothetical protein